MPRAPNDIADEILIGTEAGDSRVAALAGGRLIDLIVEPRDRPSRVGDIHLGRVLRLVPGLRAAFVDIGLPRNAFLPFAGAKTLREGESTIAQISEDEAGEKGARLNLEVSLRGRFAVLLPGGEDRAVSRRIADPARRALLAKIAAAAAPPGHGLILRTEAMGAAREDIVSDIGLLAALWAEIEASARDSGVPRRLHGDGDGIARGLRQLATPGLRVLWVEDETSLAAARRFADRYMPELRPKIAIHASRGRLFDLHDAAGQIEATRDRQVKLAGGGAIVIDRLEALTAIDVDSGSDIGGSGADIALRTDLDAAAEIPRHLRLRDVVGLVVIDFLRLRRQDQRERVLAALKRAVSTDRRPVAVLGWTAAGLVELTRGRVNPEDRR